MLIKSNFAKPIQRQVGKPNFCSCMSFHWFLIFVWFREKRLSSIWSEKSRVWGYHQDGPPLIYSVSLTSHLILNNSQNWMKNLDFLYRKSTPFRVRIAYDYVVLTLWSIAEKDAQKPSGFCSESIPFMNATIVAFTRATAGNFKLRKFTWVDN